MMPTEEPETSNDPESFLEDVTIIPDPVVLAAGRARVRVEAVTAAGHEVTKGRLVAPDGSRRRLRFACDQDGETWRAEHDLRPGDPAGAWRVELTVGDELADVEFEVVGPRPDAPVAFRDDFDVRPRLILNGGPAVVTGHLEIFDEDDVARPFGNRFVRIAFREGGSRTWEYVGEARTDPVTGGFSTEIGVDASGEVRAEAHFADGHVDSDDLPVQALGEAGPVYCVPASPRPFRTHAKGLPCYRFGLTVRAEGSNLRISGGSVYMVFRAGANARWIPAKKPGGGGTAYGGVNESRAKVYTARVRGGGRKQWQARYRESK